MKFQGPHLCLLVCTGGDECCTSSNLCDINEGDCDSDDDCMEGLKCGTHNCLIKTGLQWDSTDDCCYKPTKGKISRIVYKPTYYH